MTLVRPASAAAILAAGGAGVQTEIEVANADLLAYQGRAPPRPLLK